MPLGWRLFYRGFLEGDSLMEEKHCTTCIHYDKGITEIPCILCSGFEYWKGERVTFSSILDEMENIFEKKNSDYSGSDQDNPFRNFEASKELGIDPFQGIMVRCSDKWMRLTNLIRTENQSVVDESIEDTLMDLANYLVIALAVRRNNGG
jgi:hypothetical protein